MLEMKIAFLLYSIDENSGSSIVALDHAKAFSNSGHDVTLFTLIPSSNKFGVPTQKLPLPILNFPLWKYPWMYFFSILYPPFHLPLIKRCIKPLSEYNVVIAYDYPLNWLTYYAKKQYNLKNVWFLQGLALPEMNEMFVERLYYRFLEKFLYKPSAANVDLLLVETVFLKNLLRKRISINSEVIKSCTYLCMDTSVSGVDIRHRYQLEDDPVILYIDRLEKHKGIEILLDAFKLVLKILPNVKLIIIGKCTRKHFSRKLLSRKDSSVIYVEYVPHNEIGTYYTAATIFATCATFEEGFSHTVIEAQAFGKPVVAFKLPAHEEVVKSGETGILVDQAGGAIEFSSALLSILKNLDLKTSMSKNALEWAKELSLKANNDFIILSNKLNEL